MRNLLLFFGVLTMASTACQSEETAAWMQGAGYRWNALNHRLSFLQFDVTTTEVTMGVIGGTSTTGMVTILPDDCDFSDCQELPVKDTSTAWVQWGRVTSRKARFGHATATFDVSQQSATESVTVMFDKAVGDHVTVLLTGLTWDTNAPLIGGPSCYDPFNGWHPREMTVGVDNTTVAADGMSVTVDVVGVFEAGESLETIRQCIDAVNEQAQVHLKVALLAVAGKGVPERQSVSHGAAYGYGSKSSPEPQDDPDWTTRPLELPIEGHVLGWTALSYQFHAEDADQRGAYLRSLAFNADPLLDSAYGHATNYSPGSQLSDFDYSFDGEAVAVPVAGEYEGGRLELQLEAVVDDDKSPVLISTEI